MVWIRRNNVYALLGEFQESQFLGEDDCHPKLYSFAKNVVESESRVPMHPYDVFF